MMHPVVISEITDQKLSLAPITYLSNILKQNQEDSKTAEEQTHRVRMSVSGTQMPKDVKDCVHIYDSKKGVSTKADAKSVLKNKNESFVFSLPLYVKDHSNFLTNQFTIVHLVDTQAFGSKESEGNGFFRGISPQEILKNKKAQQKVIDTINLMQKFNVWVEASVSVQKDGLLKITQDT